MTTLLDYVALFLAKHIVWRRTRSSPEFGNGLWLGPDQSHNPSVLLQSIDAASECWCFSGKPYGECHRRRDLELAAKEKQQPSAA